MTAGSGAGDVVALEEGIISQFVAKPDKFVNLLDKGADSLKPDYLDWKWNQALTADGKTLIGLGTDIGAQGMCYRKDLFQKAGLPTDREQVGALWPTWDAYLATESASSGEHRREVLRLLQRHVPEHPDAAG